jgi:NAD+ synthase (glutamine-hydrolysing)
LVLLAAVRAFNAARFDRSGIIAVGMPCFETVSSVKNNARRLAEAYGASYREIDLTESMRGHSIAIGIDENERGEAYENALSRERARTLFDIADREDGIVLGTCDLSEDALGQTAYNGTRCSMYGLNARVPKTMVRRIIKHEADNCGDELISGVLREVLNAPVQRNEDLTGPYELHDFFLYYFCRYSFRPAKILRAASRAFEGIYTAAEIKEWLAVFIDRFFASRFKRSCGPDSAGAGVISLSPRTGFNVPSDASVKLWLDDIS